MTNQKLTADHRSTLILTLFKMNQPKQATNRLFIGKTGGVSRQVLYSRLSQFGTLTDFMLKGHFAFAEFAHDSEAQAARLTLNGKELEGSRLQVDFAIPKQTVGASQGQQRTSGKHKLYIGGFTSSVTKSELWGLFSKYGDEVCDFHFRSNYAFVRFTNERCLQEAKQAYNGYEINGCVLQVDKAREKNAQQGGDGREGGRDGRDRRSSRDQRHSSKERGHRPNRRLESSRLYVGGISSKITKREFLKIFERYGKVVDYHMKDGFAFLEYKYLPQAERAKDQLDGTTHRGMKLQISEARPEKTSKRISDIRGRAGDHRGGRKPERYGSRHDKRYTRPSPRRSFSRSRSRSIDFRDPNKTLYRA